MLAVVRNEPLYVFYLATITIATTLLVQYIHTEFKQTQRHTNVKDTVRDRIPLCCAGKVSSITVFTNRLIFYLVRTTSPNLPAFALLVLARPSSAVPAVSGGDELEAW
jgi:hypothetical protein